MMERTKPASFGAAVALAIFTVACRSVPAAPPAGGAASVTAATADVRVMQLSGTATAAVGQTIGVATRGGEWQVEFDAERLTLLTPAASLASPGEPGWVWRAVRAGTADIVFTARVRCEQPPCAPNPAQFTLSIVIK
jgi:hypothetical protein